MGLCWAGHRERSAELGRQGRRGCWAVAQRCPQCAEQGSLLWAMAAERLKSSGFLPCWVQGCVMMCSASRGALPTHEGPLASQHTVRNGSFSSAAVEGCLSSLNPINVICMSQKSPKFFVRIGSQALCRSSAVQCLWHGSGLGVFKQPLKWIGGWFPSFPDTPMVWHTAGFGIS